MTLPRPEPLEKNQQKHNLGQGLTSEMLLEQAVLLNALY
jgi:hypothetical protein